MAAVILFAAFLFFSSGSSGYTSIWPIPRNQILKAGEPFHLDPETRLVYLSETAGKELEQSDLAEAVKNITSQSPQIIRVDNSDPLLEVNSIVVGELSSPRFSQFLERLALKPTDDYPGPEGYLLSVSHDRIVVAGRDAAGIFFGLQSLKQLLAHETIPAMEVVDWPEYPMRAVYLALNTLSSENMAVAREVVRYSTASKYNQICVELSNGGYARLDMPSRQSEKTIGEVIRQFFSFSKSHHLTPRPEGHSRFFPRGLYPHTNPFAGDPTSLEGIRTSEIMTFSGTSPQELTIQRFDQDGKPFAQPVPVRNVLHDIKTGATWDREPLVIKSRDDALTYREGRDYTVKYGKLKAHWFKKTHYGKGQPKGAPFSVLRWADYDGDQEPTLVRRTPDSRIPDGLPVSVEFTYLGPDPYSRWKYRECLADPRLQEKTRSNPLYRYCVDVFDKVESQLDVFGLEFDEYRTFALDYRCLHSGRSRPQIWADFVKFHVDTLVEKQPDLKIVMWSDMIDKFHNGELYGTTGSAEILAQERYSEHIIAQPWHSGKADSSVKYLSAQGFTLLPSCQGNAPDNNVFKWRYYLDRYSGKKSAAGFQYTQWQGVKGWKDILAGENTKEANAIRLVGQASWSSAPHITLLPFKKKTGRLVISVRVSGDPYHYTPEGSSGKAVVADDAGSGGKGRLVAGPCPLDSVTLLVLKENSAEMVVLPMKLSSEKNVYRANIEINDDETMNLVIQAKDKQRTTRTPEQGWISIKADGADGLQYSTTHPTSPPPPR